MKGKQGSLITVLEYEWRHLKMTKCEFQTLELASGMEVNTIVFETYMQSASYEDLRNPAIPHEINTRYLIKKELGKGAYGTVYLAVDRTSGEQSL